MRKVKTLIISNHPATCQFLQDIFREIPGIESLGFSTAGRDAIRKIHEAPPQLLFFDLQTPEPIKTLLQIRNACPGMPVLLLSAEEKHNPALILQTLSVGAVDFILIPHDFLTDPDQGRLLYRNLQEKLNLFFRRNPSEISLDIPDNVNLPAASTAPTPLRAAPVHSQTLNDHSGAPLLSVVAVGISTGGPQALARFLPAFPADFPLPILIVQHMPEGFTAPLAQRLNSMAALRVVEAVEGMPLEPGRVYIAPGNRHLSVSRSADQVTLHTRQGAPENSCRPSVDVLFRSVAAVFGPSALAAVMTGMGQDGLMGSHAIVQAGGKVLIQDEATSVVWGMPGAVMRAGLADMILPLDHIAREIIRRAPSPNRLGAALRQELLLLKSGQDRS